MTTRLLAILKYANLSPAQFADRIGVQRSSISHVLSGRNKPGLEFIQKIIQYYPDINPKWLLLGKGEMIVLPIDPGGRKKDDLVLFGPDDEMSQPLPTQGEAKMKKDHQQAIEVGQHPQKKSSVPPMEDQIIICYTDSTFKIYRPDRREPGT